jgi:hypothetical protein
VEDDGRGGHPRSYTTKENVEKWGTWWIQVDV